jgi:peptidoglycan biosynthesis protein MviN/MurJ (putative lipid II flippase)
MAFMFPQLLLHVIAAVCAAVQQAHGRFALAAGASTVENVGATAVVGLSAIMFGTGTEIGDVSLAQTLLLSVGVTAAVGLCAKVQWLGAWHTGLRVIPSCAWSDPDIQAMVRRGISSTGYTCLSVIAFFGMLTVASRVPGGVAAFQIAYNFNNLPVALAAGSVAAVQLPELARSYRDGQLQQFVSIYKGALRLVLFVMLPGSLLLVAIAPALAQASAFGTMATPAGVTLIATCVAGRGLGALGEAVLTVATSASFARNDAASPLKAMMLLAAVSVAGMVLASTMSNAVELMLALTASATVASSLAALYLHRRQTGGLAPKGWLQLRKGGLDFATALVAVVPAWLIVRYAASTTGTPWDGLEIASAAMFAAAVAYLSLQFVRGSDEMALLLPLPARLRQSLERRRDARVDGSLHAPERTYP